MFNRTSVLLPGILKKTEIKGVLNRKLIDRGRFFYYMFNMIFEKNFKHLKWLLSLTGFLWVVYLLSLVFPLNNLGIIPREVSGLPGILCAPFLHSGFSHLAANSVSLIMLGFILASTEKRNIIIILIPIMLLGGFGTWLIGRPGTIHIGASGVIYGIFGYLLARGLFRRDFKSLSISILVFFMYGGMIFGVLPVELSMSWESHLCGFLSGVITASVKK